MRINKPKQRTVPSTYKAISQNPLKQHYEDQQEDIEEGEKKSSEEFQQLNHHPSLHQHQPHPHHLRQPHFQGSPAFSSSPRSVLAPLVITETLPTQEHQNSGVPLLKRVQAKNLFTSLSNKLINIASSYANSPPLSANRCNALGTPYQIEKQIVKEEYNQQIRPKANSAWIPEVAVSPRSLINAQDISGKTATISPKNIHLKAIDSSSLSGSSSRPPSLQMPHSDRVNRQTKRVCPEKKSFEQAQEETGFKIRNQDCKDNLQHQKNNELPKNNHKKITMVKQQSFKSRQEMNGLIHRPYQSKLLGFAFQKHTPTNSQQSSSAKSPGLNLKSNNSTSSCFLESKDDILTARSTEQTTSYYMDHKTKNQILQDNNSCSQILEKSADISQNSSIQQAQQRSFREFRAFSSSKQKSDKVSTRILQNNRINPPLDDVDEEHENESKLVRITNHVENKILQNKNDFAQGSMINAKNVLNIPETIMAPFTQRQYRIFSRNAMNSLNNNYNILQNTKNNSNNSYQHPATQQRCLWGQQQQQPQQCSSSSSSQGDLLRQVTHTLSLNKISSFYGRERQVNMEMWKPSSKWDTTADQESNSRSKNVLNSSKNFEISVQKNTQIDETPNVGQNSQIVKIGKKMIKIINPYRDRKTLRKKECQGKDIDEQSQQSMNILGALNQQKQSNYDGFFNANEFTQKLDSNFNISEQKYIKEEKQQDNNSSIESAKENEQEVVKQQIIPVMCFSKEEGQRIENNKTKEGSNSSMRSINYTNKWESSLGQQQNQQKKAIVVAPKEKKVVSARMLADMLARVQTKDNMDHFERDAQNAKFKQIPKKQVQHPFSELETITIPAEIMMMTEGNRNQNMDCSSLSSTLREIIELIAQ